MISQEDILIAQNAVINFVEALLEDIEEVSRNIVETCNSNSGVTPDFYLHCNRLIAKHKDEPNLFLRIAYNILQICCDSEVIHNRAEWKKGRGDLYDIRHIVTNVAPEILDDVEYTLKLPKDRKSYEARAAYKDIIPETLCNDEAWSYINKYKNSVMQAVLAELEKHLDDQAISAHPKREIFEDSYKGILEQIKEKKDFAIFLPLMTGKFTAKTLNGSLAANMVNPNTNL